MKVEIVFTIYNISREATHETDPITLKVNSYQEVEKYVKSAIPGYETSTKEVDDVMVYAVGNFFDEDGIPISTKKIGTYTCGLDGWEWELGILA